MEEHSNVSVFNSLSIFCFDADATASNFSCFFELRKGKAHPALALIRCSLVLFDELCCSSVGLQLGNRASR